MTQFKVEQYHLDLLKAAHIEHAGPYFGYIGIDCKRPFGNSDMIADMAEIIGIELVETDDDEKHFPKGTSTRCMSIYVEQLPIVMSIVFSTGCFKPGSYTSEDGKNWRISHLDNELKKRLSGIGDNGPCEN